MSDLESRPGRSATRTTVVAAVLVVVTFIAGFVAGVVTDRAMLHAGRKRVPPFVGGAIVERLDRRLDLTDQQRAQIERILERRHARIDALWSGIRPRVRAEIQQTNEEIARVLTPEQRRIFNRMKMRVGPPRSERRHRRPLREDERSGRAGLRRNGI